MAVLFGLLLVGCGPAKDADRKLVVELLNHGKVTAVWVWDEKKEVTVTSNPGLKPNEIKVTSVALRSENWGAPSWQVDLTLDMTHQGNSFALCFSSDGEYQLYTDETDIPFERIFFEVPGKSFEELFPELAPTIAEIRQRYEEATQ